MDLFRLMEEHDCGRVFAFGQPRAGLRAFLVLDDTSLGPAVGGTRTWHYPSEKHALLDAIRLARAMTLKCSLAGLDAGGGKLVVMDNPGLDRELAFTLLGQELASLPFHTAGDMGTLRTDLQQMASAGATVQLDDEVLSLATAQGVMACARACAERLGRELGQLHVAVQGTGSIGAAVARSFSAAGCRVTVADTDPHRARRVADEFGGELVPAHELFTVPCDLVAPCADGGAITAKAAADLRAKAICGAANNELASDGAAEVLARRGVLHVPSLISSAGAVIRGVSGDDALIWALGETAGGVLDEASDTGRPASEIAEERAWERIELTRG